MANKKPKGRRSNPKVPGFVKAKKGAKTLSSTIGSKAGKVKGGFGKGKKTANKGRKSKKSS